MAASDPASAFLKAAFDGDLTLLKRLVPETGNRARTPKAYDMIMDGRGRNALHLAVEAGNIEICKYLVENLKLDLDPRDYLGNTPLLVAIQEHCHPIAIYLIETGAKIGYENHGGYTALHCAAQIGQEEIMRLLLSKGAKVNPDLDSPAGTPLHCASFQGKNECVKILLENGADPNSVSKFFSTPLMTSIAAQSYECMELLIKAGADPNIGAYLRETPLVIAACASDTRFLIHLLKAGANPNVVDNSGETPLERAALHDWSVDGIMKHVRSEEEKAKRDIRRKNDFEVLKAKGREAFERKDYEEAIFLYTKAMCIDPTDATVLSNRSLCLAMVNQASLALRDATACVALKPDWPKAHYREGAALMLLNDYSMALEAFAEALKLDPSNKEIKKAYREAAEAEYERHVAQRLEVLHF